MYNPNKKAGSAIDSAPIPTPAPPVSSTAKEVLDAELEFAQGQAGKKSFKKTLFGGSLAQNPLGDPGAPMSYKSKLG